MEGLTLVLCSILAFCLAFYLVATYFRPYADPGSNEKPWEHLFTKCSDAREIILDSLDLKSALACRQVPKEWKEMVNCYKKLWAKINKVFSVAMNFEAAII